MPENTFDVVSKIDLQEVSNALIAHEKFAEACIFEAFICPARSL